MKMKVFYDEVLKVQDAFNKWAKGKKLTKDVIIQVVPFPASESSYSDGMAIVVIHPEGKEWDETEAT